MAYKNVANNVTSEWRQNAAKQINSAQETFVLLEAEVLSS
jgi:hypothetical protein